MKTSLIFSLIVFAATVSSCSQSVHQPNTPFDPNTFDRANFRFIANTAIPLSGQQRNLGGGYEVIVKKDTVISQLPYIGRSRSQSGTDDQGLRFTSTNFSFLPQRKEDGSWEIVIDIKDQKLTDKLYFIIFSNGSATLEITSAFRDMISFRGEVRNN